jgi:hypothetical protein
MGQPKRYGEPVVVSATHRSPGCPLDGPRHEVTAPFFPFRSLRASR